MLRKALFVPLIKKGFLCFLFFAFSFSSLGQNTYSDWHVRCQRNIYELKVDSAEKVLEKLDQQNIWTIYLLAKVEIFKQFCLPNPKTIKSTYHRIEMFLSQIENKRIPPKYKYFFLGELQFHQAWLAFQFSDYSKAVRMVHIGKQNLKKSMALDNSFLLPQKSMAVLNILFGAIPEKYLWAANAMGYQGNIKEGMKSLSTISSLQIEEKKASYWLKIEASYWSVILKFHLQKNLEKSWEAFQSIPNRDPNDLFCIYLETMIARKSKNSKEIARTILKSNRSLNEFPILYYSLGLAQLQHFDPRCEENFYQFLEFSKNQKFVASTWQKLAWWYLINNKKNLYQKAIHALKNIEEVSSEIDIQAQKEAFYPINQSLLRVRILWDGGHYIEAKKALQAINISQLKQTSYIIEYNYRKGQILNQEKNIELSIVHLKKAIKLGTHSPRCYAAKSALLLGEIYEKKKEKEKALEYYRLAMSFPKNKEYKKSIELNAKAAIKRIMQGN